jgi:poly(hydroxyalkanoate) depolymerase family esterase
MSNSQDLPEKLTVLQDFGDNPGSLTAYTFIPKNLQENAALVVVLHGSTQNAALYNTGSGWSQLAEKYGFALLFPEQIEENNAMASFSWFNTRDNHRESDEPTSIRNMIKFCTHSYKLDPEKIFITGLSSGGAMTAVMLATSPEIFAGGAIIAGLPYRSTDTLTQAFMRMKGFGGPTDRQLDAHVREASPFIGDWPSISIWHGTGDSVVDVSNADSLLRQWKSIHNIEGPPTFTHNEKNLVRDVWCNAQNKILIEQNIIENMGHGTPLNIDGNKGLGETSKYMLDVGISSTYHIADSWGILN